MKVKLNSVEVQLAKVALERYLDLSAGMQNEINDDQSPYVESVVKKLGLAAEASIDKRMRKYQKRKDWLKQFA